MRALSFLPDVSFFLINLNNFGKKEEKMHGIKSALIAITHVHAEFHVSHANLLMFSAGTLTIAGSIKFSARTNAPSSSVSRSIVAA